MRPCKSTGRVIVRFSTRDLLVVFALTVSVGADDPHRLDRDAEHSHHELHTQPAFAGRATSSAADILEVATDRVQWLGGWLIAWYRRTPPADRVVWGGLTAGAGLGLGVLLERLIRLRRHTIVPPEFTARFLDRLHEGKLDCGQALDHCELNPSPAARVALAAVRRWGRPPADLERAVALAHRVETEQLRRNVGTLRRIAVLTPLLGLLGTLYALGRALEGVPSASIVGLNPQNFISAPPNTPESRVAWGSTLAAALTPLSAGIIIATLALVAYDGLLTRIEKLTGSLDRLGAETIDAIALSAPIRAPAITLTPGATRSPLATTDSDVGTASTPGRTPHQPSSRRDVRNDSTRRSSQHETGF